MKRNKIAVILAVVLLAYSFYVLWPRLESLEIPPEEHKPNVKIKQVSFEEGHVDLHVKNEGDTPTTIDTVTVNGVDYTNKSTLPYLPPNATATVKITLEWQPNIEYVFGLTFFGGEASSTVTSPAGEPIPEPEVAILGYKSEWSNDGITLVVLTYHTNTNITQVRINSTDYTEKSNLPITGMSSEEQQIKIAFTWEYSTNYFFEVVYHQNKTTNTTLTSPSPPKLMVSAVEWGEGTVEISIRNPCGLAYEVYGLFINGENYTELTGLPITLRGYGEATLTVPFNYTSDTEYYIKITYAKDLSTSITSKSPPPKFAVKNIRIQESRIYMEIYVTEGMTLNTVLMSVDGENYVDVTANTSAPCYLSSLGYKVFYIFFPNPVAEKPSDYSTYYVKFETTTGTYQITIET